MDLLKRFEQLSERSILGAAIGLFLAGVGLLYFATAKVVVVSIDGEMTTIRSHASNVEGALRSRGIIIRPEDRVLPDADTRIEDGSSIQFFRAKNVRVALEDDSITLLTAERSPANILALAGYLLYPGDQVWVDGIRLADAASNLEKNPEWIRVQRAVAIHVVVDGVQQVIRSAAPTLAEALWDAGIQLRSSDRLVPSGSTPPGSVSRAVLQRARPITVEVDGRQLPSFAAGPSVAEALSQVGVTPIGLDYSIPALDSPLPEDGFIQVVRVQEEVLVEMEPLPFETVYQPAANLELDSIEVLDLGTYGVSASRVRIRREQGVEVERVVEDAWRAVEPSPRILGYGTKIVVRTLNTPGGPIEYWRAVPVYQTSYSPCNLGVDRCGEITASGKKLQYGMIGVIRSWFRWMRGWPVYVPDYGNATIEDIGAGIPGRHWIDLAYSDEDYVIRYGWTTLYFLTPVPPLDSIPWILP